jgi:hypothetical protein
VTRQSKKARGGVAHARLFACSTVGRDRSQLAAVGVLSLSGAATGEIHVVSNIQVTTKNIQVIYCGVWCFVVRLKYVLLNDVTAREYSAPG